VVDVSTEAFVKYLRVLDVAAGTHVLAIRTINNMASGSYATANHVLVKNADAFIKELLTGPEYGGLHAPTTDSRSKGAYCPEKISHIQTLGFSQQLDQWKFRLRSCSFWIFIALRGYVASNSSHCQRYASRSSEATKLSFGRGVYNKAALDQRSA
jgi:hypothetical protein